MNVQEFQSLKRGDLIVYDGKEDIAWTVDHPTYVSTKKEFKNVLENMSEPWAGGGGNCKKNNRCITASIPTPNGRGKKRLSKSFFEPGPWTKVSV